MKKFLSEKTVLLCGAGKMGSALLQGWIAHGLEANKVTVIEPNPSKWLMSLKNHGLNLNSRIIAEPEICIIAVKPQNVKKVTLELNLKQKRNVLFLSIAAGIKIARLEEFLGAESAIIRAMPNTPASIRKGVSCLIQNHRVTDAQMDLTEALFSVVGKTIRLNDESQMDAVTAISGSGPAYIFYMIEVLTLAGINLGLEPNLAQKLATLTVSGAGLLAEISDSAPNKLRNNVTSPNGTTEAALKVLMDKEKGLSPLIRDAVAAANARSKELDS